VDQKTLSAAAQLDACGFLVRPVPAARLRSSILRGYRKRITLDDTKYRNTSRLASLGYSNVDWRAHYRSAVVERVH
jgi:hypothetical protein